MIRRNTGRALTLRGYLALATIVVTVSALMGFAAVSHENRTLGAMISDWPSK